MMLNLRCERVSQAPMKSKRYCHAQLLAIIGFLLLGMASYPQELFNLSDFEFPRSTIEIESMSEQVTPVQFIFGPVDKVKREVSFKRAVKVFGQVANQIHAMPSDASRHDAADWYRERFLELGGELLFDCEEKDCGRATIWVNEIFEERVLSTFDSKQSYLAGYRSVNGKLRLMSFYFAERRNQRVFVNVTEIIPDGEVDLGINEDVGERLSRDGIVTLDDIVPDRNGTFTRESLDELNLIAQNQLQVFDDETIYVVCHIVGTLETAELIENSRKCAETIVAVMREATPDLNFVAFGVGPLSPKSVVAESRVSLVIPELLRRE